MVSRKINPSLAYFAILVMATGVALFSLQQSAQIQTSLFNSLPLINTPIHTQTEIAAPVDISQWKTYTNNDFYFGFRYPDGSNGVTLDETSDLKRAYLHNDWHLIQASEKTNSPVKMAPREFIFSIDLLTATDNDGKKVADVESFLKSYPYRKVNRIREEHGYIGSIPTIEDIWPTKDSGLSSPIIESKTVYAYYNDLVYEITVIPNSGIPAEMMSSFFFTYPKYVAPVGSPTTKKTEYLNNTLGFKMTFPEGWYFPSPEDSNPALYNCLPARGRIYSISCDAVRVGDASSEFAPGSSFMENITSTYGQNTRNIKNLVPGATVVWVDYNKVTDGPELPSGSMYYIYFHGSAKVFSVFISDAKLENTILSSMRLTD